MIKELLYRFISGILCFLFGYEKYRFIIFFLVLLILVMINNLDLDDSEVFEEYLLLNLFKIFFL